MPDSASIGSVARQVHEVRRQLLDAAAFGKHITPAQLESLAGKLGAAMNDYRRFAPDSATAPDASARTEADDYISMYSR